MISLLCVEVKGCSQHLEVMLESVCHHSKLISEVIIAVSDWNFDPSFEPTSKQLGNITIKRIANPYFEAGLWFGHATGLKAALDHATQDYVLFSDPDIFWYTAVDEFYMQLIKNHNIDIIGISHHNAVNQAFYYFPCVMHCMTRKDYLPPNTWLENKLKFSNATLIRTAINDSYSGSDAKGQIFVPNPMPELHERFPNKDENAIFDVGCNLWLWNEEKNGRWLSFQTLDCHTYTTLYKRSNFKFNEKIKKQNLVYHLSSSARGIEAEYQEFAKSYKETIINRDN